MSGPEPGTVWVEEWDGTTNAVFIPYATWPPFGPSPQNRHRKMRAIRIARRYHLGDWYCRWCGEDLHFDKRVDAQYCREACRKAAARHRRKQRSRT